MKRFHVLSALVCMMLLTFSNNILAEDRKDDSVKPDTQAPVITIKNEDDTIQIVQGNNGNEFDLRDYIAISDNSNDFHLIKYGNVDIDTEGEYSINLIAIDAGENTATKTVTVNVISQEEMDKIVEEEKQRLEQEELERQRKREEANKKAEEKISNEISNPTSESAYDFALNYVGMGGWCTDVAQAFINGYLGSGYNIFDTYSISASEAQAGDIIYYSNSGLGTQHYAVYLGGETALHGNFNGTTVIRSIYLKNGSEPQFLRLSGR